MSSSIKAKGANSSHDSNWLDTWWPLLVILFGLSFISVLIAWKPFTV